MKRCTKCETKKPLTEFYQHGGNNGGHRNECRACCNKRSHESRQRNLEDVRQYDKDRSKEPKRAAALRKRTELWKKRNPEKYRAKQAVNNAVRDGRLSRPNICSACNKDGLIHGHHHDYNKPLDVTWLCPPCHSKEHKNENIF